MRRGVERVHRPDKVFQATRYLALAGVVALVLWVLVDNADVWRSEFGWWIGVAILVVLVMLVCRSPWVGIRVYSDELVLVNELRSRHLDRVGLVSAFALHVPSPIFPRWELAFRLDDGTEVRFSPIVARFRPSGRLDGIVDDLDDWIREPATTTTIC